MNFMFESMTSEEIENRKSQLTSDIEYAKIVHAFESNSMMHDLRLRDIEQKIILENCSLDEVADLYAAERDLYMEATDGILSKFFAWLSNIIKAIFGIKENIKVDDAEKADMIDLPIDVKALNSGASKFSQKLKSFTSIKDDKGNINWGAVVFDGILGIGTITGVSALVKAVRKPTKISKGDAETVVTELDKTAKEIASDAEKVTKQLPADGQKASADATKEIVSAIKDAVTTIKNALGQNPSSGDSSNTNTADKSNNTNDDSSDEDNNDAGNNNDNKSKKEEPAKDDPKGRYDAAVAEITRKCRIEGRTAFCSDQVFKNLVTDRREQIKKELRKDGVSAADKKFYVDFGKFLESLRRDPNGGGVRPFSRIEGRTTEEEVSLNLKKQCEIDENGNVGIDAKELKEVIGYYQDLQKKYPNSNDPYNKAAVEALRQLSSMKPGKNRNNGAADDGSVNTGAVDYAIKQLNAKKISVNRGGKTVDLYASRKTESDSRDIVAKHKDVLSKAEKQFNKMNKGDSNYEEQKAKVARLRAEQSELDKILKISASNNSWGDGSDGRDEYGNKLNSEQAMSEVKRDFAIKIDKNTGKASTTLQETGKSSYESELKKLKSALSTETDEAKKAFISKKIAIAEKYRSECYNTSTPAPAGNSTADNNKIFRVALNYVNGICRRSKGLIQKGRVGVQNDVSFHFGKEVDKLRGRKKDAGQKALAKFWANEKALIAKYIADGNDYEKQVMAKVNDILDGKETHQNGTPYVKSNPDWLKADTTPDTAFVDKTFNGRTPMKA